MNDSDCRKSQLKTDDKTKYKYKSVNSVWNCDTKHLHLGEKKKDLDKAQKSNTKEADDEPVWSNLLITVPCKEKYKPPDCEKNCKSHIYMTV